MNARRSIGSIKKRRPILMNGIFFAHRRFRTVQVVEESTRAAPLISSSNGSGAAVSIGTMAERFLTGDFLNLEPMRTHFFSRHSVWDCVTALLVAASHPGRMAVCLVQCHD